MSNQVHLIIHETNRTFLGTLRRGMRGGDETDVKEGCL
jgi:hypothetical protein